MNEFLLLGVSCALLFASAATKGSDCRSVCNLHHGICDARGECRCAAGWGGGSCDRCVPRAGCAHGACGETPGRCVCDAGWSGDLCDRETHVCSSKPCSGDSTCVETEDGGYLCICPSGYTGRHCQLKKGPCLSTGSHCQNGGTCIDRNGFDVSSSCICPPGFTGSFCEMEVDKCESNPCANGGTCRSHEMTYSCVCPPAFSGPVCNFSLTVCSSSRCMNGGTCFNLTEGGIHCVCAPGFTGPSCEFHVDKFKPKPRFKPSGPGHPPPHYTIPAHAFHKLLRPPERELLKISMKETVHVSAGTQSQIICFALLGLLTCLVVLLTTGIIFFNRCETWMVNARYSQLVHQLRAADGEERSVNIILPEKIKLTNRGKLYTSI